MFAAAPGPADTALTSLSGPRRVPQRRFDHADQLVAHPSDMIGCQIERLTKRERCCGETVIAGIPQVLLGAIASASVTMLTSVALATDAGSAAGDCPCSQMQSRKAAGSDHRSARRLPTTI